MTIGNNCYLIILNVWIFASLFCTYVYACTWTHGCLCIQGAYTHMHSHTPPHCLIDVLLTRKDSLWFTLIPFRFTCLLFVLIVTSPHCHIVDTCAALAKRLEHWLKQSKWVGLTLILWWLTFLCTIWVDVDFVHYSENCRILKLPPLFSFHIIYLLLLSNSWSKLSSLIIASIYRDL